MAVPLSLLLHQGPVIRALLAVGWRAATSAPPKALPALPAPAVDDIVDPRHAPLVAAYRRWLGASGTKPDAETVPPHLFPQWGFPLLSAAMGPLPYPMTKVLNQGCRITVNQALPAGEDLHLTARLEDVREEPRKARIHTRLTTGTPSAPDAVVADVFAVVPLPDRSAEAGKGKGKGKGKRPPRPGIPLSAAELTRRRFGSRAGRDFAVLTGDLNPIHGIRAAARAAGFQNTILHGFATLGWAWEGLLAHRLSGDGSRLAAVEVRFVKPLVLPAEVGLYVWDDDGDVPRPDGLPDDLVGLRIAVATAPGAPPFMAGTAWVHPRA